MFSLLDMVNHYLGYVNLNVKLKNRIYTILGVPGVAYLLYVGIRYLQNGFHLRGGLILLASIVLAYFLVMNIFYYFTSKQPPFDISPKIEKLLGVPLGTDPAAEAKAAETQQNPMGIRNVPANGYFDEKKVLPGKVSVSAGQQENINRLVTKMMSLNLVKPNYGGLSSRQIATQLKTDTKPVWAIGLGVSVPYFELQRQSGQLIVLAGINQADKAPVGRITTVGLQPISQVADQVKLYLANAILVGGPHMAMGRNAPIEQDAPYAIRVQLAYERTTS